MFCKNCGKQLNDYSVFCPKCGTRILTQGTEKNQKEITVIAGQVQKPKKRTDFAFLIGILIIIVGIGIGAMILFFKGKGGEVRALTEDLDGQEKEIERLREEDDIWGTEAESEVENEQEGEAGQTEDIQIGEEAADIEDVYAVFGVTQGKEEDYGANLNTNAYQYYNSGISDFRFFYPADLYGEIRYSEEKKESLYGTNITTIDFVGSEGSELVFSLSQYQGASIDEMSKTIYNTEKAGIVNVADVLYGVYEDYGRIIVTGFTEAGSKLVYDLIKIDAEYVMQMKIIFPVYQGNEDKFQKDYMTECLYRLCGFSGSTANCRSYDKYKEESIDLEAEIEKIHEWYYQTQAELDSMDVVYAGDAICYMENETSGKIVVSKGAEGINYIREYFIKDGRLYFAFVYDENGENKLYFVNNMLVRYIDEESIVYNLEEADRYVDFASELLNEAYRILEEIDF